MKKVNIYDMLIHLIIVLFTLFCFIPILIIISISFTDENALNRFGFHIIPKVFSIEAYKLMFKSGTSVINSYLVTIFVTVVGTISAMLVTMGAAYCLANKHVQYRNGLAFYFFFTMLFSGGLVPWYLINSYLGLRNNLAALIIPSLMFNAFNMFLVRNYMAGIPDSLMESATIDGAGEFTIAAKIYFPLCLPVIAAVSLFYAIGYWNDWWNAIMLVEKKEIYPLQFLLFKIQSEAAMLRDLQQFGGATVKTPPTNSLKMATCIVTMGPIVLLYPLLQRYFIQGLIIGSVKG
jgi:putative aldouronate transport system permease protein